MYKIINGKRKPASEEMVDKMRKFMHLSPVEESALKEAYNITLVGSDNYYRRKDVLHFFEDFSLSSVSIPAAGYSSELDSPFDGVILLNTPAEINRALLYILSTELQKETGYISMLIQPDYDFLINILAVEGHYKSGVNIDHLICINNNSESAFIASHKNYNLQCLKQILPLYGNNYKYNCFYYYDNILSMDSSMTLFPYIIITSGYACLLTSDYQKGYLSHDRETIRMFTDIFKEHLKKASPLLHRIDSPFMQLEYVQSLFCGSTRSCFFQMTPCFTPFITLEMMEKCISKDMPHRREFIDSFHSYVKNLLQSYEHSDVSLIFSLDGVIRFLETGKVGEYPPEVYIPFGDYMLRYDARNITLSAEIDAGLVESLGLSASLAIQNLPTNDASFRLNSSLALEFTHINVLGTTRYNLNVQERSDTQGIFELPSMNASIGHQISTGWTGLSSVTLGASYIAPDNWDFQRYNPLSLNLSMSGRFGIFSWGLSVYSAIPMNEPADLSWSVSGSFGLYAGPNFSISGSIGVSDSASGPANISGRISATYRFGIGAVTATAGLDEATVSTYVRSDKHYFRADVDSNGYKSINDLGMSAGYSYSGNLFDVDLDLDTASLFRNIRASATVSTSTIFADGVFAMASSVPSNYLLVRQYGSLKGNDLFVGSAGSSATREIPSTFGTGIYTGVSTYNATNIGIFSSGDNVFGGTSSYSLSIPYSARTGYVLKLHGDNVYAASGVIILPDGTPWLNGASPLYSVDSETEALNVTEHYLFTDSDGRFTATGQGTGRACLQKHI